MLSPVLQNPSQRMGRFQQLLGRSAAFRPCGISSYVTSYTSVQQMAAALVGRQVHKVPHGAELLFNHDVVIFDMLLTGELQSKDKRSKHDGEFTAVFVALTPAYGKMRVGWHSLGSALCVTSAQLV